MIENTSQTEAERTVTSVLLASALGCRFAGLKKSGRRDVGRNILRGLISCEQEHGWKASPVESVEKGHIGFPVFRVDADIKNTIEVLLYFRLT